MDMRDGLSHLMRVLITGGAGDLNLDELGRAFAVTDNGLRQLDHDLIESIDKGWPLHGVWPQCRAFTSGGQHAGVVGTGIPVHGNTVKRGI